MVGVVKNDDDDDDDDEDKGRDILNNNIVCVFILQPSVEYFKGWYAVANPKCRIFSYWIGEKEKPLGMPLSVDNTEKVRFTMRSLRAA